MTPRKIVYTILTLIFLFFAFLITGILAPAEYRGSITEEFPDQQIDIWKNLISLEAILLRKPDVDRIEVIEEDRDGIVWIEHLKNGNQRTLRVVERNAPNYLVVDLIQSDNRFVGRWTYNLAQDGESKKTQVTIEEQSYNANVWLRAWHTILGRSINLRREIKSLRVSLFQRLLTTP